MNTSASALRFHDLRRSLVLSAVCVGTLSMLVVSPRAALALGLGGRGPVATAGHGGVATKGGYFDGKSYSLGLYLAPLFGYESNYKVTTVQVEGSAVWAVEGGAEFRYRPSSKLRVRAELGTMVRMPLADSALTEFLIELPAFALYRLSPALELSLGNHFGFERSKTPPVFLDGDAVLISTDKSIRYYAVYETLSPSVIYHLNEQVFFEAGPYVRIKQINMVENPPGGEPDYRLFDLGGQLAAKYRLGDLFSARLRYDIARRFFTNYKARPPEHEPRSKDDLGMTRNTFGLSLGAKVVGPLRASASYNLRLNGDNGGFFDYVDHVISGGLSFSWRDRITASVGLTALLRSYTNRTRCEAVEGPVGTFTGADCRGDQPNFLPQSESGLLLGATGGYALTEWLQIVVSYELEEAGSDENVEDPLEGNHRILGGVTVSL